MRTGTRVTIDEPLLAAIRGEAVELSGAPDDHEPLLELIGDARVVLLGEASHGTHEFYRQRALITKRLIEKRGFCGVAVEADWPDALRVSRFAQGAAEDADAEAALRGFERFPTWMWRNADVLDFVGWLRARGEAGHRPVGFFGLDLYSLYRSIEAVIGYLERIDPVAASRARERYGCLERFEQSEHYGAAVATGVSESCDREALAQLVDLQRSGEMYLRRDGIAAEDEQFYAEQNARLVVDAERYYRSMFAARASSWNLRDRHMAETLARLLDHLDRYGERSRVVVWAHNSHVGDARRTEMSRRGELNLGQLARERFKDDAFLVGFTTFEGTVSAASDWGAPVERKRVRPGLAGSYERLLHETGMAALMLPLRTGGQAVEGLREPRLERAIGVIYRPETERASHYFAAELAHQFDALLHFDRTRAVEPLEPSAGWERGEPPETYPSAL
jgi:erythromycin esterase-like protein